MQVAEKDSSCLASDIIKAKGQLDLLRDKLTEEIDVPPQRRAEYRSIIGQVVELLDCIDIKLKKYLFQAPIVVQAPTPTPPTTSTASTSPRPSPVKQTDSVEDLRQNMMAYAMQMKQKYQTNTNKAEAALKAVKEYAHLLNDRPCLKELAQAYIKNQGGSFNHKCNIPASFSTVKKPGIENSEPRVKDFSAVDTWKLDDDHIMSMFNQRSNQKSIEDFSAPRQPRAASPLKSIKKYPEDYFSFKDMPPAIPSSSAKKKTMKSEFDMPDFTLESLTNQEVDPARIADKYEVAESNRKRALLNAAVDDVLGARSLPISLKGSSTFQ
jgi:hypothetical protein